LVALAAVAWLALFVNNHRSLEPAAGFDARHHLAYVQYILDQGSLPAASFGFQTYQPPLYYLLAAALLQLVGTTTMTPHGALALRVLGLVCGLITIVLVTACLRRLFVDNERAQLLGTLVSAFLPCQLYLYQFPTNEMLLVTLASATLFATLRVLDSDTPPWSRHLALGTFLGLVLLTKVSGLLVLFAVVVALFVRLAPLPRRRRAFCKLGATVLLALVIGGWHYVRLWTSSGSPLAGSWESTVGVAWWQDPGYRTWRDYARFGRALAAPLFAGFAGLPDGLYSTLWGDGLASGARDIAQAPAWSYDLMSMGYLVALLPTAACLLGGFVNLVSWLRRPDAKGTLLVVLSALAILGIIYVSLRGPSVAHTKAFHAMFALVPLVACIATGLDRLMARSGWAKLLVSTMVATWALLSFAAFWIDGGSPRAMAARGQHDALRGDLSGGVALLRAAADRAPGEWAPSIALARVATAAGAPLDTIRDFLALGRNRKDSATRHLVLSAALDRLGRVDEALAEARRGLELDPDSLELHDAVAELRAAQGDRHGAVHALRQVLRISPRSRTAHSRLGVLLKELGQESEAEEHLSYAARLAEGR